MKATAVLAKTSRDGGNCDEDDCPTAYRNEDGRIIVQGDGADHAEGVRLGDGEHAVVIPESLARELARALDH